MSPVEDAGLHDLTQLFVTLCDHTLTDTADADTQLTARVHALLTTLKSLDRPKDTDRESG